MGPNVHTTSIGIASCHRPLRGQRFDTPDRPSGTQDALAHLFQLSVRTQAQPPPRPAEGI
ncbi:hypothetical protein GCM10009863_41260 [Streptomyces axinellae]|uniref:Uncharacterized protein n=1 Tax=Streptomyces axinellae TaxID=552788 RepID=A0ABP6CKV0_9ACTN